MIVTATSTCVRQATRQAVRPMFVELHGMRRQLMCYLFCCLHSNLCFAGASSQAKVVELHGTLTRHASHAGVSDEQLLVDNARLQAELESSLQHSQQHEG